MKSKKLYPAEQVSHVLLKPKRCRKIKKIVEEEEFWLTVAFLSDLLSLFNKACIKMQGEDVMIFKVYELFIKLFSISKK